MTNRSEMFMKTQLIDLMQIHNLVDWQTHIKTLRDWKEEGRIPYLGIIHYDEIAHEAVIRVLQKNPIGFSADQLFPGGTGSGRPYIAHGAGERVGCHC